MTGPSPLLTLNNSVEMPAFGLDVYQSTPEETIPAVTTAIENGYRLIDTAAAYGNEKQVGEGIVRSGVDRGELFVTTKLWLTDYGYDSALRAFDTSLANLALDYLDLYLLHQPVPFAQDAWVASYKAAEKLLADGRVRAIGVSNHTPGLLRTLMDRTDVVPAVNQVELHPYFIQRELREVHAQFGIVTQSWSPIGGITLPSATTPPSALGLSPSTSSLRRRRLAQAARVRLQRLSRSPAQARGTGRPGVRCPLAENSSEEERQGGAIMRRAAGIRHRGIAAVAVLATVLTAAGCGTDSEPTGSRTTGSADTADSDGKDAPPKAPAGSLTWDFEHIADFSGELTDVAVLAEDDIWAVGTENNGESNAHLLHYDGTQWKREPLPEALGTTDYPPVLEEVGEEALWLRPQTYEEGAGVNPWARWDGTRWSAVPNPPPGNVGDFEAAGPDDIWARDGEQTAQHWDGTRWTTTRLPYGASDLAVVGPDDVWAVGSRSTGPGTELSYGERYGQPASMHWDGTSWKSVETPQARFEKPIPPEPSAGLGQVFVLDSGEVRAYGNNTFNHGEVENEPADEYIRLRWDGSKWVEQERAPGGCAVRTPMSQDDEGLFLDGNWYLADDGRCVKIKRRRLPLSTGARKGSNQSLWLKEIHRVPGTDEWLGAGHVQVNQSGDPFGAPVVVRLKRGG